MLTLSQGGPDTPRQSTVTSLYPRPLVTQPSGKVLVRGAADNRNLVDVPMDSYPQSVGEHASVCNLIFHALFPRVESNFLLQLLQIVAMKVPERVLQLAMHEFTHHVVLLEAPTQVPPEGLAQDR
jgi:hypothetical protein